jgi:sensor domain CHASE-containing protein/CheY-like chemotaxis protein
MVKLKTLLAPVLLFALVMALVHGALDARLESERAALRREIESLCLRKGGDLAERFSQLLTAPGIIASMVYAGAVDESSFEVVAKAVRAAFPGLESMSLAPGGVISAIDPRGGREHLLGMDFLSDPIRAFGSAEAARTGRGAVTGPFTLASGRLGFLGKIPAFTPGDPENRFWGFVAAAMPLDRLIDASGLGDLAGLGFTFRLEKRGSKADGMEIVAGSPGPLHLAVSSDLDVSGVKLRLTIGAAAPPAGPEARFWDYLEGAALALALSVFAHQFLGRREPQRAGQGVREAAAPASNTAPAVAPDVSPLAASPAEEEPSGSLGASGSGPAAQDTLAELARGLSGRRVLVAAGGKRDREAAADMLGAAGILADLAQSGRDAVDRLSRAPYDAVLVDLSLPDLDHALAGLRRDGGEEGPSVLALGGRGTIDDRIRALECGMEDHVPLPLDAGALLAALRPRLMGRPAAGAALPRVLDKDRALAMLLGNAGLYARLLSGFAGEYAQAGSLMRGLVSDGKLKEGGVLAHSIKGLAANLGGGRLHAAALDLESALGEGRAPSQAALGGFEDALDEFLNLARQTAAELAGSAGRPG